MKKTGELIFSTDHFSLYTVLSYQKTFKDIENHWARNYIETMASKHITKGKSELVFDPDNNTSRAEFVALIVRAVDSSKSDVGDMPYGGDVSKSKWYYTEIENAYSNGILSSSVNFNPEVDITREDMMVIIADALKYTGDYISITDQEVEDILVGYSDIDKLSEANKASVALVIKNGIINGRTSTTIAPDMLATRAETMVVVTRLLDMINK